MYIKNSMGPRTVPWGTPERTGWEEDCVPSETTLCDLPCKKIYRRVASTHDLNAILFPPSSENTALHSCLGDFKAVASLYWIF